MHDVWHFPKVVLKEALKGVPRGFKGRIVYAELVKQLERDHEALLRESAPTTKQGKRKATTTQQQGTTMSRRISGGGSGVSMLLVARVALAINHGRFGSVVSLILACAATF